MIQLQFNFRLGFSFSWCTEIIFFIKKKKNGHKCAPREVLYKIGIQFLYHRLYSDVYVLTLLLNCCCTCLSWKTWHLLPPYTFNVAEVVFSFLKIWRKKRSFHINILKYLNLLNNFAISVGWSVQGRLKIWRRKKIATETILTIFITYLLLVPWIFYCLNCCGIYVSIVGNVFFIQFMRRNKNKLQPSPHLASMVN